MVYEVQFKNLISWKSHVRYESHLRYSIFNFKPIKEKSKFVTKFVGITVTIIFM